MLFTIHLDPTLSQPFGMCFWRAQNIIFSKIDDPKASLSMTDRAVDLNRAEWGLKDHKFEPHFIQIRRENVEKKENVAEHSLCRLNQVTGNGTL